MKEAFDNEKNPLSDEERITTFGTFLREFSLDEFLELINGLRGELSFVGPRPLLGEYMSLYNDEQKRRHDVKPRMTDWAQVSRRNAISWKEKFKLDVWYVGNRSFFGCKNSFDDRYQSHQ